MASAVEVNRKEFDDAQALLRSARETCSRARPTAYDAPEMMANNVTLCRNTMYQAILGTLAPFVNLQFPVFVYHAQHALGMAASPEPKKPVMPTRDITKVLGWGNLSAAESRAIAMLMHWRMTQIWYGATSPDALNTYATIHTTFDGFARLHPTLFDSLAVALCFNMCVRADHQAGGNVPLIASVSQRSWFNRDSALMRDPFSIYILTMGSDSPLAYAMAQEPARSNLHLAVSLVLMTGDDVLQIVPPELHTGPQRNGELLMLRRARRWHYANMQNARPPFLTSWDMPAFGGLVGKPKENVLVDNDSWLQGYTPPP